MNSSSITNAQQDQSIYIMPIYFDKVISHYYNFLAQILELQLDLTINCKYG